MKKWRAAFLRVIELELWTMFIVCDDIFNGGEDMKSIDEIVKNLPSQMQREVVDFAEYLVERYPHKRGKALRQDWAGALKELKNKYTSVQLQKKALEWRGD